MGCLLARLDVHLINIIIIVIINNDDDREHKDTRLQDSDQRDEDQPTRHTATHPAGNKIRQNLRLAEDVEQNNNTTITTITTLH